MGAGISAIESTEISQVNGRGILSFFFFNGKADIDIHLFAVDLILLSLFSSGGCQVLNGTNTLVIICVLLRFSVTWRSLVLCDSSLNVVRKSTCMVSKYLMLLIVRMYPSLYNGHFWSHWGWHEGHFTPIFPFSLVIVSWQAFQLSVGVMVSVAGLLLGWPLWKKAREENTIPAGSTLEPLQDIAELSSQASGISVKKYLQVYKKMLNRQRSVGREKRGKQQCKHLGHWWRRQCSRL